MWVNEFRWWERPRLIGDYEMGETIGKGAYGKVKVARDRRTGKSVAIKIIDRSDYRYNVIKKFYNEVLAMTKLTGCKHIVHLESYAFVDYPAKYLIFHKIKAAVITMEKALCDLDSCMYKQPFSFPVATNLFYQLQDAICYCHDHGICHRDIKTSNILVSKEYRLLLADFGLAHNSLRSCKTVCGTHRYMAPEIIQTTEHEYNGCQADVWSAGICYMELLTGGRYPYMIADHVDPYFECIDHHDWVKYKQLRGKRIGLPEECYVLLEQIMISDPEQRPTARQIMEIISKEIIATDEETEHSLMERIIQK